MNQSTIAHRVPLPCTVPPGGVAVVLANGRFVSEGVQGPGELEPNDWRGHGQHLEAVVFPSRSLRLRFEIPDLPTAEGVTGPQLSIPLPQVTARFWTAYSQRPHIPSLVPGDVVHCAGPSIAHHLAVLDVDAVDAVCRRYP